MATTIQSLQGVDLVPTRTREGAHLFGIRHLSPAGAWHLQQYLDQISPDAVLIEGPSDASGLINDISRVGVKPPVAILCYTTEIPVHSIIYPYAIYSPEYQAILWATEHKRNCQFIDLPSQIKSPLYRLQEQERIGVQTKITEHSGDNADTLPEAISQRQNYYHYSNELYKKIAMLGGEEDYETYWERNFEHNLELSSYHDSIAKHSAEMRELTVDREKTADPLAFSINALREAYMKRKIQETIAGGIDPNKIVVVCGSYHVSGLINNDPMNDEELQQLPRSNTKMTLMPYSYYKLSSFSGYGAGNHAPYYYQMMWQSMESQRLPDLPAYYLTKLSALTREKHGYSSTASVIEALRLAKSLQFMHNGTLPTLKDLDDSAVATMGNGQLSMLAESFATLNVGTEIGSLPEGVSQTPVQDDMNRYLKRLKLEKYKTVVAQNLALDLRENRKVKSTEAAFLDLERSIFLHRLRLLGVNFGRLIPVRQDTATWSENWVLCWTPEVEIQIVESVLYGDTIETAAAYSLRQQLENSNNVLEVATLVRTACDCRLSDSIHDAILRLQALASESEDFSAIARSAREMSFLIQYGSIRRYETEAVIPILVQLFLKGTLLMLPAGSCNNEMAREIVNDMTLMHYITQEHDEIGDDFWLNQLSNLAFADDKNALVCGFAFAILLERQKVTEDHLSIEVSRRLSPGNTPEEGAGWFEGLSKRNRYVLLSRIMLWKQLDLYLADLDDEQFKRALICLRRAFSDFEPYEKNGICELLAELWGVDTGFVAELLQEELTEQEELALDELNDFDFGDLL